MTSENDTQLTELFWGESDQRTKRTEETGTRTKRRQSQQGEKISLWLAYAIIFFLVLVFSISALIVRRVYFQPPVIRTAVERELVKYKTAIKDNPRNAEAHVGLAGVYLEIEEPGKAVGSLRKAIEIEPRSWNAHFELGIAYDALGKPNEAISHLWQAARIDSGNELAFYQLGRLYQKQKLYGQAIQAFKQTLRINPTLADAHYYLGQCYETTNKHELAKKEYRESLKYVERYPEAEQALKRLQ